MPHSQSPWFNPYSTTYTAFIWYCFRSIVMSQVFLWRGPCKEAGLVPITQTGGLSRKKLK